MSDWLGIVWLVILLVCNAFFVGAEFAVVSARRSQIEPRAEAGSRAAKTALWAMEHVQIMLAVCQLGITVCSLLILNVSEPSIHHLLEVPLHAIGWPEELVATVAFIVTLMLVTFLHVVFGEMVPKNLSFTVPDRAVMALATPLVWIATVVKPIVIALNAISNGLIRIFGVTPRNEADTAFTLDQVETIVQQSTREGVLGDAAGTLEAAFEFTTKRVVDVAVPLDRIVTLPEDATADQVEAQVARHGYSRYVLVDGDGEPTGFVHIKDVIALRDDEFDVPVPAKRIRRLASVYEGTELEDALADMRRQGAHIARTVDGAGSTRGVLFLEDILEELVGEVDDASQRG